MSKVEIVLGARFVPRTTFRLIDAKGEEITDDPVSYSELVTIILDSEVKKEVVRLAGELKILPEDQHDFFRDVAVQAAEHNGYRVLEISRKAKE